MSRLLRFAFGASLAVSSPVASNAARHQWQTYTNARFGTVADYPASFGHPRYSGNGDDVTLTSPDGGTPSIYGFWKVDHQAPVTYDFLLIRTTDTTMLPTD